jgi:L-amino acid N-acyltransferase YncA
MPSRRVPHHRPVPGDPEIRVADPVIRLADPERDSPAVAAIYRPAVESSVASFEEVAPDAAEMAERIGTVLRRTPWLVAVAGGERVVGYAYATRHRERAAYRWSVDISAYVHPEHRGRGVGRRLYDVLLPLVRGQGFVNVFAGITLPNPASVALHESIGMRRIGVYERIGYKFGAWHDVAWYGMRIAEPAGPPPEPLPVPDVPTRP